MTERTLVLIGAEEGGRSVNRANQSKVLEGANGAFCTALQVRPDVVLDIAEREGLSAAARSAFEDAKRRCYMREGWRSKHVEPDLPGSPRNTGEPAGPSGDFGP